MFAAADDHTLDRADIFVVTAPGAGNVLVADRHIIGGIEVDPAIAGIIDRGPGMAGVRADQLGLTRRWPGQQGAGNIARRQTDRPQAGDLKMGKVLADASPQSQHLTQWGRDRGRGRIIGEILMNTPGQVIDRLP